MATYIFTAFPTIEPGAAQDAVAFVLVGDATGALIDLVLDLITHTFVADTLEPNTFIFVITIILPVDYLAVCVFFFHQNAFEGIAMFHLLPVALVVRTWIGMVALFFACLFGTAFESIELSDGREFTDGCLGLAKNFDALFRSHGVSNNRGEEYHGSSGGREELHVGNVFVEKTFSVIAF